MKMLILLAATALGFAGLALAGEGGARTADLAPGAAAPDFSLPGSDGKTHSLADHRGERAVVIAWFPKAFTGG
jgi:peroxiredoxin Q/BCP